MQALCNMKSRYILYILIALLTLSVPLKAERASSPLELEQTKRRRTTPSQKKKKKLTPKKRTSRRAGRVRATKKIDETPIIRTLSGVVPSARATKWQEVFSPVPRQIRFMRGDTTLTTQDIEQLYYADGGMSQYYTTRIQEEIQREIHAVQYAKAYQACRKALWHDPIDLSLIKRAGELANHIHLDKEKDIYIWQLAEILHLISQTGTGATIDNAYEVHREEDAAIFEKLWLDTPLENIISSQRGNYEGYPLVELHIKQPDTGKTLIRYYRLRE